MVIIAVLGVGGYFGWRQIKKGGSGLIPGADELAAKGYAAVFLANDQVYFGKVSDQGSVVILKDVYYIRLNQSTDSAKKDSEEPQLSLVKLGDQIHGPVDEMRINKEQVLFVERIKDESTVVRAIMQEKDSRTNNNSSSSSADSNTPDS